MMELEHDAAGATLKEISSLSSNYAPPDGACFSYRTLYAALKKFRDRSHQHIHLENNMLFPRAISMEEWHRGKPVLVSMIAIDEIKAMGEPAILHKDREESRNG